MAVCLYGIVNVRVGKRGSKASVVVPNASLVDDVKRGAVLSRKINDVSAVNRKVAVLGAKMVAPAEIHF